MKRKVLAGFLAALMIFTELPSIAYSAEIGTDAEVGIGQTTADLTETGAASDGAGVDVSSVGKAEKEGEKETQPETESETETETGSEKETETEPETERTMESEADAEQTITEFAEIDEPVIAMKEKLPLEEALEQLPETLEVYVEEEDSWTEVPVTWECVDDYDDEDQSSFVFVATPESDETAVDETQVKEENLPKMEIYYDDVFTAVGEEGGRMAVSRMLSDSSIIMEELEEKSEEISVSTSARGISVSSDDREFWESLDDDDCHNLSDAQKNWFQTLDTELNAYLLNNKAASQQVVNYNDGTSATFSCTAFMQHDRSFNNDSDKFIIGNDPNNIQTLTSTYLYAHPQYFFVTTSYLTTTSGKLAINFLPDFVNVTSRNAAAREIKGNITSILGEAGGTDREVLRQLHNALCALVSYDEEADTSGDSTTSQADWVPGNTMYDQSMASVFYGNTRTTVCAGYSQAYEAACNAAGIPAFSVNSLTHQWNKVKTADYWFNVDVTWDDGGMGDEASIKYFLKSDAAIKAESEYARKHHTLLGCWNTFLATTPTEYSNYDASTITFDLDGKGTLNGLEGAPVYAYPVGVGIPASVLSTFVPESEEYDFLGWYRDAAFKSPVTSVSTTSSADLRVYAKWQKVYSINYEANGGTLSPESPTRYIGVNPPSPTFSIPDPEKDGCSFMGWYWDPALEKSLVDTSCAVHMDGATTVVISKLKNAGDYWDLTLYAAWSYGSVLYSANAPSGEVTGQTVSGNLPGGTTPADSVKAAECGYTRTNYVFDSWNTMPDGSGTKYEAKTGDIPSAAIVAAPEKKLMLYAQWKPVGLTVTYDAVGGEFAQGVDTTIIVAEKASFTTPSAADVTKNGYTLSGWIYTNNGKQTTYSPGKSVKNSAAVGEEWELDAKWTKNSYSFVYQLDGGSNSSLNPKSFSIEDGTVRLYKASKSYHDFIGWSYEKNGTIITDFSAESLIGHADTKNKVTLYAVFDPYTYEVIYHMNAGNVLKVSSNDEEPCIPADGVTDYLGKKAYTQVAKYGVNYVYYSAFEREGYQLSSWNTRSDGKGTKYTPGAAFKNLSATKGGTIDLYAQWTASSDWGTYRISYYEEGDEDGVPSYGTTDPLAPGTKYLFKSNAVKPGYTLSSWQYMSADGKTKKTYKPGAAFTGLKSSLKLTGNDPIKLTAMWSLTNYSVTYANMTGAKQDTKVNLSSYTVCDKKTGMARVINLAVPVKPGYIFGGWFKDAEFTTPVENNKISSANVDSMAVKNKVTVYAKWTPIRYTVAYYAQQTPDADAIYIELGACEQEADYGSKYQYAAAPERPGYTFAGWSRDNKGTKYKAGASYSNLSAVNGATVKMYAQWTLATYKMNYDLRNGDSNGGNPTSYKLGAKDFSLKAGKRSYADFLGWYENEEDAKRAETLEQHIPSKEVTDVTGEMLKTWAETGNKTFYAAWKCNKKYRLRFRENYPPNGRSTGMIPDMTVNYGDAIYMPDCISDTEPLYYPGFTLLGWSTNPTAKTASYTLTKTYKNLTSLDGETVTMYGIWKEKPRTISYVMNGGSKYSNTKEKAYSYPTSFPLVTDPQDDWYYTRISPAKRTGYRFEGWYLDAAFTNPLTLAVDGESYLFPYTESDTAIKIYAKWEASYHVYYDKNGGVFADGTSTVSGGEHAGQHEEVRELGESFTMPGQTFVRRNGYTLLGWATSPTASSATYNLTKEYKNLKSKDGESITVYAVWKPYSISYDLKGGSKAKNVDYPTKYTGAGLRIPDPVRTGYTFIAWYLSPDFDEEDKLGDSVNGYTAFNPAEDARVKGDVKLYAGWEAYQYTVRYWASKEEYERNLNTEGVLKPEGQWVLDEAVMKREDRTQACNVGDYYYSSTRACRLAETLSGWCYETVSGTKTKTVTLTPGAKFKDLTKENGVTVNVWATWKSAPIEKGTASAVASGTGSGKITLTCDTGSLPGSTPVYLVALNRNTGNVEYLLDTDPTDSGITPCEPEESGTLSVELELTAETPDDALGLTDHSYGHAYAVDGRTVSQESSPFVRLQNMSLGAAILASDGTYQAVTNAAYVKNPETLASTSLYQITETKKGIQLDDANGLAVAENPAYNMDHAFVNLRVATLYLGGPYTPEDPEYALCNFGYNGKGYLFNNGDGTLDYIRQLNERGISVTGQLLLESLDASANLVHSKARASGHRYYSWEDTDQTARETIEALSVWLGRACGNSGCYVSNWIIGNEVNSYKAWQFSGTMTKDEFFRSYAETVHIFYNGIKSTNSGARFFVCTDNNWNKAAYGYSSKTFLDTFNTTIDAMDDTMEWGIAFHPYAYPLTSVSANTFWKNSGVNHTDNSTYVNMSNLDVLTNHAKAYTGNNTVPDIILSELGYTPGGINATAANENLQAAALIYSYAIAAANDDIDAFIIRSLNNTAENPYLGIARDISNPANVSWRPAGTLYALCNRSATAGNVIDYLNGAEFASIWKTVKNTPATFSDVLSWAGISEADFY